MPWSNNNSGWRGGGNGGPWGSGPTPGGGGGNRPNPPDLEEILRRGQDRLKTVMPGGGALGGRGLFLLALVVVIGWLATGIYRVQEGEQGVVLRFGEFTETTPPGLQYHLPWPIETALTPAVERINRIDVGLRDSTGRRGGVQDVPEESLMLTGDENIVDIDFAVFWKISNEPGGAGNFLFNISNPEATVKSVAESAMRQVVGEKNLEPTLTDRAATEQAVFALIQETLNNYSAGIEITQVQLLAVDPPSAVIDAFRDVQAAEQDRERVQNEARAYANRVVPEARGEAARVLEAANAYRERTVAEARGEADRFVKVFEEYRLAPDVTRQRLFLETMERVLGDMDKVIIDSDIGGSGVVPYLPLNQLQRSTTGGTE